MSIDSSDFETTVSTGTWIVKFTASWCGPCKAMKPIVEAVMKSAPANVKYVDVDVDENADIATKFGIRGVPTFVRIVDGEEVERHVGMMQKAKLEEWTKK
jgi:thioredoxin 1